MNIRLINMTLELCHTFFKNFKNDLSIFASEHTFYEYQYSEGKVNDYWRKNQCHDRVHLAILEKDSLVGEIILKNIDQVQKTCTLSIHMMNDSVKNLGYGTEAERQAIIYAQEILKMRKIYADARIHNKRSQHVLKKVGFQKIDQDNEFVNYVYELV